MRRRFRSRGLRRKKRVVWFVPPVADPPDDDGFVSCYSDAAAVVYPLGAGTSPTQFHSPIVWNIAQALSPLVDPGMKAHPTSERWTIERIVGDILISPIVVDAAINLTGYFGWSSRMGIVRGVTLGDALVAPSPSLNDSANASWMWLHSVIGAWPSLACDQCTQIPDAAHPQIPISSSQVLGLPTSIVVPVDLKVKRTIRPEEHCTLCMDFGVPPGLENGLVFYVTPKLRALLSRTV